MTATNKPRTVLHKCSEKETLHRHGELLERLSIVTLGNGHPEDGLLFMFRSYLDKHKDDDADIKEIRQTIKTAIDSDARTAKALELYKVEMAALEKGKKAKATEVSEAEGKAIIAKNLRLTISRDFWYKALTIFGISVTIFFAARNNKLSSEGQSVMLPDSSVVTISIQDTSKVIIFKENQ